jgi:hypothetical protein
MAMSDKPPDAIWLHNGSKCVIDAHLKSEFERLFPERFIKIESGCWLWTGAKTSKGYGLLKIDKLNWRAHRVAYFLKHDVMPPLLDHICQNRLCVNPEHLRAVSNRENVLAGSGLPALNAAKTHCKYGHPLLGDNVRFKSGDRNGRERICITCDKERKRNTRLRAKAVTQ